MVAEGTLILVENKELLCSFWNKFTHALQQIAWAGSTHAMNTLEFLAPHSFVSLEQGAEHMR